MTKLASLLQTLGEDKRGEGADYGMVVTIAGAVIIGLAALGTGLDGSFHSLGALLGAVRAGL